MKDYTQILTDIRKEMIDEIFKILSKKPINRQSFCIADQTINPVETIPTHITISTDDEQVFILTDITIENGELYFYGFDMYDEDQEPSSLSSEDISLENFAWIIKLMYKES